VTRSDVTALAVLGSPILIWLSLPAEASQDPSGATTSGGHQAG